MFVACKIPNGLILSGAGKQFTLLGPGKVAVNERPGGYAITPNVPNDIWEEWAKTHADSELIQNHLVFAEDNLNVLQARAWGRNRIKSGFEQTPPRPA